MNDVSLTPVNERRVSVGWWCRHDVSHLSITPATRYSTRNVVTMWPRTQQRVILMTILTTTIIMQTRENPSCLVNMHIHTGSTSDNCLTLTFDLLTPRSCRATAVHCMSTCLPSLAMISCFPLKHKHTDTHTDTVTDRQTHTQVTDTTDHFSYTSATAGVSNKQQTLAANKGIFD